MEKVLAAVRAWTPYDGDAWLDDVGDALDRVPPADGRTDELARRLRGYLGQLVAYAVGPDVEQDEQISLLVVRARTVRAEHPPCDQSEAIGYLRRMGWAVNELLDLLVERQAVKGPDSLNCVSEWPR